MIDTVIKGGTVVTPAGVGDWDIGLEGEKIAAVAMPGVLPSEGVRSINATGKIVVPGGVEAHAHAAAMPHEGINALNGVIHLFSGIDSLRQHLREDTRIHGVITDGGRAPNVVPEYAAANFMLRCRDRDYLNDVIVGRVLNAAEGAAAMTGCRLEVEEYYPFYENVRPNSVIAGLLLNNAEAAGLALNDPFPGRQGSAASTDFGNVSQALPSYELRYAVSEQPVASHSREMTETAISDYAIDAAINVAKTMTLTVCDLLLDPGLVSAAQADFEKRGGA